MKDGGSDGWHAGAFSAPAGEEVTAEGRASGSDLATPELHLAGLLAEVRAELARRDAVAQAPNGLPLPPRAEADWEQITRRLAEAEQFADAGATAPGLRRWPRPLRWLGRLAASCVLLAARVVTNRQRRFNHEALHGLRRLHEIMRQREAADTGLHAHLGQQQASVQGRLESVAGHEQALRLHDDRLHQVRTALRHHGGHLRQLHELIRAIHARLDEHEARVARLEAAAHRNASEPCRRENAA